MAMIRKICFGLVAMLLGTVIEFDTHFFTDYASVFYGLIGMSWGLLFGVRDLMREKEGEYHEKSH